MDGQADTVDGHHPLVNATIKLLSFSSRVFHKLRSYDLMLEQNAFRTDIDGSEQFTGQPSHPSTLLPSMGAWRFWTSGYALVLLTMVSANT